MMRDENGAHTAGRVLHPEEKDMDPQSITDVLEKKFKDAFVDELIPGIVHNFANPLNGIMGRAKLLHRKLMEIAKSRDAGRDVPSPEENKKLITDVESISREADRLSAMLQHVTGKFCAINDKAVQQINLSDLIEREMKFVDFYLEFKHSVKKTMSLEKDVPLVKGVAAEYSLALSTLILHSMGTAKESDSKEFNISSQNENGQVCIKIQHRGGPLSDDLIQHAFEKSYADASSFKARRSVELWSAFALLRKWGARFEIDRNSQWITISVIITPYGKNTL